MKIRSTTLKLLLCTLLLSAVTSVFGQTSLTWVGPTFGDLGLASNWDQNLVPNPDSPNNTTPGGGDQIIFNGNTPGVLTNICQTGALTGASGSTIGLYVLLTANQTSPVTFISASGLGGACRLQSITNNGAGITIGDNGSGNTFNTLWGGINGQIQELYNAVPGTTCTFNSGLQLRMGGAGAHNFTFDGPGNWNVTNDMNNANTSATIVTKNGTGTMVWYSTNNPNLLNNGVIGNPVSINGGQMILKTSDSFRSVNIGTLNINDNAFLEYDDVNPAGGGKLSGNINGTGTLQVNSGTLTLSGQNTYSGSNILSGGELIANSPESAGIFGPLGTGSTISLIGGTLGYGPLNAFDYSSRFDTAPNQKYNIDTGGQFVFYATPLASSGGVLNKIGSGVLTLTGGASYSGPTHVSGGKLVFQGPMTGTGNITVDDGAALGVFNNGTQVSPSTLTLGSSSGSILEFNALNSTTTAPLNAGTLVSAGTQVININSGTFIVGQTYPLLSWTSGTAPGVVLGQLNGFIGNLQTNGNTIQLFIVATAFSWTGAANNFWDLTSVDWLQNGGPVMITNNAPAILDDTTSVTNVIFNTLASPTVATFNNQTNPYTLTSSATFNLGGNAKLFMAGNSTLTLTGGANTYTGVTTFGGGTTIVSALANGGTASDIGAASTAASNTVFNGGVLQYTGPGATINRLFTLDSFGGTIDNEGGGTLAFNSTSTNGNAGGGARSLTWITGNATGDVLGSVLADGSGATALVKQGTGTLILTGNNVNSGLTTINNGTLQIGNGGGSGTMGNGGAQNNTALVFNRTGTVTVFGAVDGIGSVTQNGTGTVILANDNGFSGGLTINSGTVQLGNGGPTGSLNSGGAIVDNGTLVFNRTGTFSYSGNGLISGTGNVIAHAGRTLAIGANTYTGWTQIDPGATFQPVQGQTGTLVSSVVTNNGTLQFQCQDIGRAIYAGPIYGTGRVFEDNNNQNTGSANLTGTNSYVGGTWIAGGNLLLGDGVTPVAGALFPSSTTNVVIFTNAAINDGNARGLIFNRPDSFTFSNHILGKVVIGGGTGNPGTVFQLGSGTVTLIGTNTYQGGTTVSNGALVVGNGGSTGAIGSGPIRVETAGGLTFNRTGTLNVPGNITGAGSVASEGSGVVNLNGANNSGLVGSITVSNGVLGLLSAGQSDVNVFGGTLAPGGYQTVGTLTIPANLNIQGNMSMALNTALAQSNSFVNVTGAINYTSGTLNLINVGPTLQVGQRFVLFSAPVAMPVTTSGNFTVANNLAVDGSVTVASVAQPPPASMKIKISTNLVNITITATNNFGPGGSWDLLGTNKLNSPITNWPILSSGHFDANGNATLSLTNPIGNNAVQFLNLRTP